MPYLPRVYSLTQRRPSSALVLFLFVLMVALPGKSAKAENGHAPANPAPLFQMALEDLLSVSVAAHDSERIIQTPGIVSRYSMNEMSQLGLHRLIDVLHFIPGVTVQRAINGTTNVFIRGLGDNSNQGHRPLAKNNQASLSPGEASGCISNLARWVMRGRVYRRLSHVSSR